MDAKTALLQGLIGRALSQTECDELVSIVRRCSPRSVLQVGHYTGLSTVVIWDALTDGAEMLTIDHHLGDAWAGPTEPTELFRALQVCSRSLRGLTISTRAYERELAERSTVYDFVFYDGPHTAEDCVRFWALVADRLAPDAVVCFDDADWDEMEELHGLLLGSGFEDVTHRVLRAEPGRKKKVGTYTIAEYRRTRRGGSDGVW